MRLTFNRNFKSIFKFDPIDLPEFTVLTGVNGAGKSHLLEAIENGSVTVDNIPPNQPNGSNQIRRFDCNSLVPRDTGSISIGMIGQEQSSHWMQIIQNRESVIDKFKSQVKQIGIPAIELLEVKKILALDETTLLSLGVEPERTSHIINSIRNIANNIDSEATNLFVQTDHQNRYKLITSVKRNTSLPLFAMEQYDFYEAYPKITHAVDLFQQSFARLFTSYQRLWQKNKLRQTAHNEGESRSFLSEEEFQKKHGIPPWKLLNDLLSAAEFDFKVNEPDKWEDEAYEPILTDKNRGAKVKFNDLSSGERILMSFALCLYHANNPDSVTEFPKLLLFDEIDAPLHPSMTRSLLRTIQTTLVEQYHIKVILTTHSPSTVALAPAESIYVMHKYAENRLQSKSKDAALSVLTAGVPTLSINYENRWQVFVESKYDVEYYSSLYEKLKPKLYPEISLSFIASAAGGNGNCTQVINFVEQLVANGNKTVAGIIDWDNKNNDKDTIFVLGRDERYSIENFLLDPTLIGLLLLREKFYTPFK